MGALACSQGGVARARPAARWATRAAQGRLTRTRTMYLSTPKSEYSCSAYEFLTRREGQSTRSHCQLNGLSENNVTHLFYLCMETIVVDKQSWNRQNKSIIGQPRLATGCNIYTTKCRCVNEGNFETEIFAVVAQYLPKIHILFISQLKHQHSHGCVVKNQYRCGSLCSC